MIYSILLLQKRKKKKKKAGIAEGPSSLNLDISDVSLTCEEKKMMEDQSSDSDVANCTPTDALQKPMESSSHLSKPDNESTESAQLDVSALSIDAAEGQSDSCVAPGPTAKASPPVSVRADQQMEKVERKKKGQKSISTGAETTLDQNANIKSSTCHQMETDGRHAEEQKNRSSNGHTPVELEQNQKQQSAHSGKKKKEAEKHNETTQDIQHVSPSKKYAKCFDEF